MLWKFQKEFIFSLLLLISIFLFRLKADAFKPKEAPAASLINYRDSFTREVFLENKRLRDLLDLPKRKNVTIAAIGEVSTLDPIGWPSWLIVKTDRADRIRPGLTVLDANGNLVGYVTEKQDGQVKIMTILNPQSRVSVFVQESRELGILESDGMPGLTVGYIPNDNSPRVGSAVVTSRLSHNYLSGIPVGTIQTSKTGKGFFRKIVVRPGANFSSLEEVVIVY